jgi:hypothetical protein
MRDSKCKDQGDKGGKREIRSARADVFEIAGITDRLEEMGARLKPGPYIECAEANKPEFMGLGDSCGRLRRRRRWCRQLGGSTRSGGAADDC